MVMSLSFSLGYLEVSDRGINTGINREGYDCGTVPSNPVNLFDAMVALPVGMADAASIIFLVFLIGGAFTVVDESRTPLPRDHHVSTRLVSVQGSLAPPRHRLAATRKNAVVKCRARP